MADYKKIIVFTNSYPYGNGYNWLDSEIALFQKHFQDMAISPYSYEGNKIPRQIPQFSNLKILNPCTEEEITFTNLWMVRLILTGRFFYYLAEFFKEKVYSNSYWFKSWLQASLKTEKLLQTQIFADLTKEINKSNTVLYYYWGNNQTLLVPFLKKMGYGKIVVRFHGFDLYKDRLGGYQPFRRPLLEALSIAAPISEFGLRYLKQEYSDIKFNARVLRLGVKGTGKSPRSQNGCVNIVSCSRIIRLKRIELIPRILKQLPFRIKWTHIGDGEFINLVYEEIKELPQNMKFELTGWMSADEVPEYYRNNAVDLFISLSESEGIPVSIMEALAAGIPVFSTDVGGIREIVNDEVGCLIDPNLTVEEMVELLAGFIKRYFETPELFRNRAHQRFEQMCDQEVCNRNLLQELLS